MSTETASPSTPGAQRRPQPEDLPIILDRIWGGESLRSVCRSLGLHGPSTDAWMRADKARREQYERAREHRADALQEEALTLTRAASMGRKVSDGDGGMTKLDPAALRIHLDAIKWAAGKMAPKTHGDVSRHEHSGPEGGAIRYANLGKATDDELRALEALLGNAVDGGGSGGASGPDSGGDQSAEG